MILPWIYIWIYSYYNYQIQKLDRHYLWASLNCYSLTKRTGHTHRHAESSMLTGVFCTLDSMTFVSGGTSWSWCFAVCSTFQTWCLPTECLVKVCRTEWAWRQPCVRELARWTFCCNKQQINKKDMTLRNIWH